MISVVINGEVKIDLLYWGGGCDFNGEVKIELLYWGGGLTVISKFSVKLSCVSFCMLCSCISLWISCRYYNLFSAQLCNLLIS